MSTSSPASEPERKKSLIEKLGAGLPVALTAIATAFAGLSTSEMTRSMYWRSVAAQDQSKANDQWSLAGFKRDRALIVQTAASQIHAANKFVKPKLPELPKEAKAEQKLALDWLAGKGPPLAQLPKLEDEGLAALDAAVRKHEPEEDLLKLARKVNPAKLDAAIAAANAEILKYDLEWQPALDEATTFTNRATAEDRVGLQAARYEIDERRYRAEARLNQGLGYLYDSRVKISAMTSDRHRIRSENFFYAMLAAQIGATASSLALARRLQSSLWAFASFAGIVALLFGAYVYLSF